MFKARFLAITGLILAATATRLIPHPPNFAPITAIALFGGAYFTRTHWAFIVPLAAMLLSDIVLGFHTLMPVVYGCFAIIVFIGVWLRKHLRLLPVAGATLVSSIIFFYITNFGVWFTSSMYPKTIEGLIACYVAAIPFFQNTLTGNIFYTAVLFGGFSLAQRWFPILQESAEVHVKQI